jgi:hypothetical protein
MRVADEAECGAGTHKLIRLDPAAALPAPHSTPRPARRTDWKHG